MSDVIPRLQLSHGQVAWAICGGQPPTDFALAQLRYLRTLGIPFGDGEKAAGSGNRVTYGFNELIEVGVAFEARRKGVVPRDLKQLVTERKGYRRVYRACYEDIPAAAYTASWVKSQGRKVPGFANDYLIYIQGRFSDTPGKLDMIMPGDVNGRFALGDLVDRTPGHPDRIVIQLKRLMISLLAWAGEAPAIQRGPKT